MDKFVEDLIGYDEIVNKSMEMIVHDVLKKVAKKGLPGQHYFVIKLDTTNKDLVLPKKIRSQYPKSMKIILQHQFKIVEVTKKYIGIKLFFSRVEELVKIPFDSILEFTDPYMDFSLSFNFEELEEEEFEKFRNNHYELEKYEKTDKNRVDNIVSFDEARKLFGLRKK